MKRKPVNVPFTDFTRFVQVLEQVMSRRKHIQKQMPFRLTERRLFLLFVTWLSPDEIGAPEVHDIAMSIEESRFNGKLTRMRHKRATFVELMRLYEADALTRQERGHRVYFRPTAEMGHALMSTVGDLAMITINDLDKAKATIHRFERLFPYRFDLSALMRFPLSESCLFVLLLALDAPKGFNGISAPQVRDIAEQIEMSRFHGSLYRLRKAHVAYAELDHLRHRKVFTRETLGRGCYRRAYFQLTSWARSAFVSALKIVEQDHSEA
jgi:hypothetical protein